MTETMWVRCTPEMKAALEAIARQSVARNISDHIRFAVERYIAQQDSDLVNALEDEAVPA
ncbi:MAG: ribbon-helix-helix protein, CopG family [Caldilineaceae bacterium]|nr:ribbon-helix-helix protein, CopG family [Caldilineaceae bacterium]